MQISKPKQRTKLDRLKKAYRDPRSILVKILQKGIDVLRGYSYDFEKNGERELLVDSFPKLGHFGTHSR